MEQIKTSVLGKVELKKQDNSKLLEVKILHSIINLLSLFILFCHNL